MKPITVGFLLALALGCSSQPDASYAQLSAPSGNLKIFGPFVHEHLALYVVEDPSAKSAGEFVTLAEGLASGDVKVSEIMVKDPVTATPEMEVNDLRRTMLDTSARYLPVMQDGKLLGVISFRDVAKAVLEEQDFENKMLKGYIKNWPA